VPIEDTHNIEQALLVEDDPFMQAAVSRFLDNMGYQVQAAATCTIARDLLTQAHFHLAVLDLAVPQFAGDTTSYQTMPGLQLAQEIKSVSPATGIVIWSAYTASVLSQITALIQQGHAGIACLPKGSPASEFRAAVESATNGHFFLSQSSFKAGHQPVDDLILKALPEDVARAVTEVVSRLRLLSPRELAVAGRINRENEHIAAELDITDRTVAHYIDSIYTKLGFKDPQTGLLPFSRRSLIALVMLVFNVQQGNLNQ